MMYIHKKSLIVSLFALFILLNSAFADTIFIQIEFFKNRTAKLVDFYYTPKNFETFFSGKGFGEYRIEIWDKYEKILYSEKFGGLNFEIMGYNESGEFVVEDTESTTKSFRLNLPENSYFIIFYYNEEKILNLSLPNYICNNNNLCEEDRGESKYLCPEDCEISLKAVCGNKVCESPFENSSNCCIDCGCSKGYVCKNNQCIEDRCGNSICESFPPYNENFGNCPKDCPSGSKDNYCDKRADNICDPDCMQEGDIDCIKPRVSLWIYVVIGVAVATLIFLIILLSRRIK